MTQPPTRREFLAATAALAAAVAVSPELARAVRSGTSGNLLAIPFDLKRVRLRPGPFRDALDVNRRFVMALDPDRLLHSFRATAGVPSTAEPYHGWEAPTNELRGHFVGHYLSACALLGAQTGDAAVAARGDRLVAELAACQRADGYLSAFPSELFDRLKARRGVWAPFYTLHKIMAGLLDSHTLSGNAQALTVLRGMVRWTTAWTSDVDDALMTRVLNTEFGGMSDLLYQVSALTGDASYATLAHRFDHERILAPLAEGRDLLKGVHANTTIPKIIGSARRYEVTGEQRSREIAEYFWSEVTAKRCFATGGASSAENFKSDPGKLSTELNWDTQESCVTYNMLKLTRQLFGWTASAAAADYYERALFNGILGTQHPTDGEKIYYTPLAAGYWRMFGTPDHGFWCCHGSGIESFAKFGDSIYFHDDTGVWVNLFIASELDWSERGVRLVQDTEFPRSDTTILTIRADRPTRLNLRLRIPYWATGRNRVTVNGTAWTGPTLPGSYATLSRTWKDGDRIALTVPMRLHLSPMPDDPTLQAVMYGPLVLAGRLGAEGTRAGPTPPRMSPDFTTPPIAAPAITASGDVTSWVAPVAGKPLEFTTVGQERQVTLAPFHQLFDERYVVYWRVTRT